MLVGEMVSDESAMVGATVGVGADLALGESNVGCWVFCGIIVGT